MSWDEDKGLTLFELVVAMSIFAVISVMGLQSLTGTMRARDRLVEATADTQDLAQAISLLRADLAGIVPIPFGKPGGGFESSLSVTSNSFSISVSGQRHLTAPDEPAFHRVTWQADPTTGRLVRTAWPTLIPASPSLQSPAVTHLENVSQIGIRVYRPDLGWVPAASIEDGSFSSQIPQAIEVSFVSAINGRVTLIETFQ